MLPANTAEAVPDPHDCPLLTRLLGSAIGLSKLTNLGYSHQLAARPEDRRSRLGGVDDSAKQLLYAKDVITGMPIDPLLGNSLPRVASALALQIIEAHGSKESPGLALRGEFVPRDEMKPLGVFLGDWHCISTVYPRGREDRPVQGVFRGELKPILGGTWYEWDYSQDPTELHPQGQQCRYTFGYSPPMERFVAIYFDDRGNHLVEYTSSADWEDGHLRFTGTTVLKGEGHHGEGEVEFLDDFTSEGPGHLHNRVSITAHGETWLHATLDFRHVGRDSGH